MAKKLCCWVTLASRDDVAAAASITTVESPTTTTGNIIIVGTRINSTVITVTSVTDTAGNSYSKIASASSSVTTTEMWYAWNITGNAANFVTANFSGAVGSRVITATEFQGVKNTANPLDTSATGTANAATATTGAFTTAEAEELVVAVSQHEAASGGWGAYRPSHLGVFQTGNDTTEVVAVAYRIYTSIQTGITITMGSTPSVPRQLIIATFKLADASGSGGAFTFGG